MKRSNNIQSRLKDIRNKTDAPTLAEVAYTTFKKYTPKLSGNAKNKTQLKSNSIHANYPYAKRLDEGYSKQNGGVGMTEPTIKAIQEYLDKKV